MRDNVIVVIERQFGGKRNEREVIFGVLLRRRARENRFSPGNSTARGRSRPRGGVKKLSKHSSLSPVTRMVVARPKRRPTPENENGTHNTGTGGLFSCVLYRNRFWIAYACIRIMYCAGLVCRIIFRAVSKNIEKKKEEKIPFQRNRSRNAQPKTREICEIDVFDKAKIIFTEIYAIALYANPHDLSASRVHFILKT